MKILSLLLFVIVFIFPQQGSAGFSIFSDLKKGAKFVPAKPNERNSVYAIVTPATVEKERIIKNVHLSQCPNDLSGLTDGWDVFSYAISNEMAADLVYSLQQTLILMHKAKPTFTT